MAVMTINGKVDAGSLGIVTPHEHIFIDMSVFFTEPDEISRKTASRGKVTIDKLGVLRRNPFAVLDNVQMIDEETQYDEIMYFKRAGGRTIVDATTIGLGRDPELLASIAARTGLNIIMGAGFYVQEAQRLQALEMTVGDIEQQILKELHEGIGHTAVKAGIIGEVGVSHVMYPFEERSLIATCRAQAQTGAPLLVHINPWSEQGIVAMKIINSHRIPADRVVICHSDVENHEEYILRLLDMGVYIEFDNFGKEMATDLWDVKPGSGRFVTDWERVRLVKKLLDKGYEKQMLLSCDVCLKTLLHAYGGWGYDHVLTHIVPMLREVGVTQAQVDRMLVENPARWLDWDC